MTLGLRPGVHYERLDRAVSSRAAIRSDIAGIVELARRGPLDAPVPVRSYRQFTSTFGGPFGGGYMAYAARAFFETGGDTLWCLRAADRSADRGARAASADLGGWRIVASSPGVWGDTLTVRLRRERRDEAVVDVAASTSVRIVAETTGALVPFDLIEVSQPGLPPRTAVVAAVAADAGALDLTAPGTAFPYRGQSIPLDPSLPARVSRVSYAVDIREGGRLADHVSALSPVPENPRFAGLRLGHPDYARAAREGLPAPVATLVVVIPLGQPSAFVPPEGLRPLNGGRDGLVGLTAADFIGDPSAAETETRGLAALGRIDEIALLACPDIHIQPVVPPDRRPEPLPEPDPCLRCPPPPEARRAPLPAPPIGDLPPVFDAASIYRVQAAMVAQCEAQGERFALLDPPRESAEPGPAGLSRISAWRSRFDTASAALLWPWIEVHEEGARRTLRAIPPSGHILGSAAALDLAFGVHRAPANVALTWTHALTAQASEAGDAWLNEQGICSLRAEGARGIRLMGARTLSSDPVWRYINVRRLVQLIRRAAFQRLQWAVFEPNDATTRAKVTVLLTGLLAGLQARGAFAGATAEESFFVRCDETTTTRDDRDEGRMIALISIAPAAPLEFLILRVGRQGGQLTIDEGRARP